MSIRNQSIDPIYSKTSRRNNIEAAKLFIAYLITHKPTRVTLDHVMIATLKTYFSNIEWVNDWEEKREVFKIFKWISQLKI